MTQQNGPLARDEGAGPADHPTNQEPHAMTLPFSLGSLDNATGYYPSQIGVFCDDCGTTFTGDYVVHSSMTRTERLAVARKHLTDNENWDCGPAGDLCPNCKADEPGMCPACDTAAIERCVGCGSCRCDTHEQCVRPEGSS